MKKWFNFFIKKNNLQNFAYVKDLLTQNLVSRIIPLLPPEQVKLVLPKTVEKKVWEIFNLDHIELKEVRAVVIPNGSYIPKFCSYITSDRILIEDLSIEFAAFHDNTGFKRSIFRCKLPKQTYCDKTVAILDSAGAYNYSHWIINILPKIHFLEKSGINIDYYVVDIERDFQREFLQILDFPMEKIIPVSKKLNIKAKNLIATNLPSSPGAVNPLSLEILAKKLSYKNKNSKTAKKIFITRRSAAQGRKITNEEEVVKLIEGYGFKVFELEKLSIAEKISLFSSAEVILSPHGAGLANIAFCKVGTKVIEIFNPNYRALCYWILANLRKLDYYYLVGDGERRPPEEPVYDCYGDIAVNIKELQDMMGLLKI